MTSPSPPRPAAAPRNRSKKKLTIHVSVFNEMRWPLPNRDWAEDLPLDALLCILHRLGAVELLIGGVAGVCRAARDEPVLWRRIDMRELFLLPSRLRVRSRMGFMVREALRLSAGQCEVFYGDDLRNELLLCLAEQAPSLKSLHVIRSSRVYYDVFAEAIRKFPLLEELELSPFYYGIYMIHHIVRVCPRLKHFTCVCRDVTKTPHRSSHPKCIIDIVAFAIARMHELRSLHLIGDLLGNKGLTAILDNCPNLEYLNLHCCPGIDMEDDILAEKCAGVYMDDYDYFQHARPPSIVDDDTSCSDSEDDDVLNSYYLAGDLDDLELEAPERVLESKGMLRYLS